MNLKRYRSNLFASVRVFTGVAQKAKIEIFKNKSITPLYFHNPNKRLFEFCVKWLLENNYTIISSDHLTQIMKEKKDYTPGMVWISFDDGWKENLNNVIPLVKKYKIPVTLFISTHAVENEGIFWWSYVCKERSEQNSSLPEQVLKQPINIWKLSREKREQIFSYLRKKYQSSICREVITIKDIKELSKLPEITLGSHTVHHPLLETFSTEKLEKEIVESKEKLEQWSNRKIKYFSFPHGSVHPDVNQYLKKYHYNLAFIGGKEMITPKSLIYRMPRIPIGNNCNHYKAICQMVNI